MQARANVDLIASHLTLTSDTIRQEVLAGTVGDDWVAHQVHLFLHAGLCLVEQRTKPAGAFVCCTAPPGSCIIAVVTITTTIILIIIIIIIVGMAVLWAGRDYPNPITMQEPVACTGVRGSM